MDVLLRLADRAAAAGLPKRIISFGYPDFLDPAALVKSYYRHRLSGVPTSRTDSLRIAERHGLERSTEIVETVDLLHKLGLQLDVIDVAVERGMEMLVDLNYPIARSLAERYSVVFDGGTAEHCFNIAQVFLNSAELAATGGFVVHANPITMLNHGFYNLNPTLYHDFYSTEQGFEVEALEIIVPGTPVRKAVPPAFTRFGGIPDGAVIFAVAHKTASVELSFPVQRKYRR